MTAGDATALVARIREVLSKRYHHRHPFNLRLHAGQVGPQEFRGWLINRFYYQARIPIKDALVLSKLPSRQDRRRWVKRILYHDGRREGEGGVEGWLRLGEAAGIPREEMATAPVLPTVRSAVDAYVEFCRARPWREAVASSLTELVAPRLIGRRVAALEEFYPWVEPQGLDYFRARMRHARGEAQHALELVTRPPLSSIEEQAAVEAVAFKCDVLWRMLDAIEEAYSPVRLQAANR